MEWNYQLVYTDIIKHIYYVSIIENILEVDNIHNEEKSMDICYNLFR